jgi:integrase
VAQRRSQGEGGLHFEESRQRWFATVYVGYTPSGKRRKVKVSASTKTEAKARLREMLRAQEDGQRLGGRGYTVGAAVESWLAHGLAGRSAKTVSNRITLARKHVIPALGPRRLTDLSAEEVDEWLSAKAAVLSTSTLHKLLSILRQSIRRAQARDLVRRNVALLCDVPRGTGGRPSRSLTLADAELLLRAAEEHPPMHAYIVVSLLTGARTEELRALTWAHVDLDGDPPTVQLWRSVREGGDTKTSKSRRTLELPVRCVMALRSHRSWQLKTRLQAGEAWTDLDLVFSTQVGTELDAANVRRAFRAVVRSGGLRAESWTPRELRHSFVSLLSSSGMPIEDISHLVGHANTRTTEKVYRKELRPVLTRGARAMDDIFKARLDRG